MAMTTVESLKQIYGERAEGTTATLDTTQSIAIPIVEEPDMTTVMSENIPEPSLPTTVPVVTLTWMENDDNSCSSISSNSTVGDTLAKVNTESEMEELWTSNFEENKNQFQQKLNDITSKLNKLIQQNKLKLGEQFKQKELEIHQKFAKEKFKLQQKFEKKNRELEHERALKAQLSKELKEVKHEYYLRSTVNEKQVRELTQKMNELRVTNERLRGTKLKRNIIREDYNNSKYTVDQLNMLVITCSVNDGSTKYYVFRRKLKGLLHAINKKTNTSNGEHIKFWYVSSNAIKDFDECKKYLNQRANENNIKLKMQRNTIDIDETSTDNIVKLIRAFGEFADMIKLDEKLLQNVIEIYQKRTDSGPVKVKQLNKFVKEQSDEMFKDIYNHIMEDLSRLKL